MAPSNLPSSFNATSQDIEMLLAAQCHLGSKNLQVHMEPYLWKTRPDGINVINIGKTWYELKRFSWNKFTSVCNLCLFVRGCVLFLCRDNLHYSSRTQS